MDNLRRLRKLLMRRGTTRELAEDLVQEAMLRLHAYRLKGGEVRDQDAFVTRVATNLAVDAHRRGRAEHYECIRVEELSLIDSASAPDEVLAAEQRLIRLTDALERANPRTREIFFMHRVHGLFQLQIAEQLGITVSAVGKHIARAVAILALQRQQE